MSDEIDSTEHIIRLQRAWQRLEWDADETLLSNRGIILPDDLTLDDRSIYVTYERRFNRPSNLEPHEQVWLRTELLLQCQRVALNEQRLPHMEAMLEIELTSCLLPHNYLQIFMDRQTAEAARTATAVLKIVSCRP